MRDMIVRYEDLSNHNNDRVKNIDEHELASMKKTMTCSFDDKEYTIKHIVHFTSHINVIMLPKSRAE